MKAHLMSLITCLSLGFWCSYGSADYVDDQVRKYCGAFMDAYLGTSNLNYTLNITKNTNLLSSIILGNFWRWSLWKCNVSNIDRTSNIETKKEHTLFLRGLSIAASRSADDKTEVYKTVANRHTKENVIGPGVIEYNSEGELYFLYVAVWGVNSSAPLEFYEVN